MNKSLIITPKTKILDLIQAYPVLEDVLIDYVPAFKKLKNPVLRKTVARVATVRQAASVGEVPVQDLVNRLRSAVGQDLYSEGGDREYNTGEKPHWFDEQKVSHELDVQSLLDEGNQPVHQVLADLKSLPENEIYAVIAPLLPAPLIDKAESLGFDHWVVQNNFGEYKIYFFSEKSI
ncbi:MAG: DUF1858 domain-containing protein [Candidatus Marinimicrobia bacterium]|nr:DUF1858 domain-containing protein [Candidatus Neomarinimicrobiota bacterium]